MAMVAIATAIPAWRAGRVAPVEALAIGRAVAGGRASRLARLARSLRLPVVLVLGAKDAFARPTRAALTVASLVLAAVLVVCAMGFEATINRLSTDSALRAKPWELRVSGVAMPRSAVDRLLLGEKDVTAVARVYEPRLVSDDGRTELSSRVVEPLRGGVAAFPFAIPDGRGATAPGELTLGRGALDRLGVQVGDRIRLRAGGVPFTATVVGRHVEPDDGGRVAVLPAATLPERPGKLDNPYWVAQVRPGADAAAVEAAIQRAAGNRLAVERPVESMQAEAADTRPIIYGVTALLLVIAAANLLTTLLLGVRERRRDAAVLGAVGATPGQVGATVVAGAALLTAIASLAGLPLGALLYTALISTTDPADGPDVVTLPGIVWILLAAPVALTLTAAVSSLAARQAARVPAAAVLRAE
jgi:putative ABC transport system permease protein